MNKERRVERVNENINRERGGMRGRVKVRGRVNDLQRKETERMKGKEREG